MKKHGLHFLMVVLIVTSCFASFAQNQKCLALCNLIISNTQGKVERQTVDYNGIYCIRAGIPSSIDFETIKTICDTTAKTIKVAFNWRLNIDKNYEKEFIISGKTLLITYYKNDNFLYFEFSNE